MSSDELSSTLRHLHAHTESRAARAETTAETVARLKQNWLRRKSKANYLRSALNALRSSFPGSGLIQAVATLQANMASSAFLKSQVGSDPAELNTVEIASERAAYASEIPLSFDLAASRQRPGNAATQDSAR